MSLDYLFKKLDSLPSRKYASNTIQQILTDEGVTHPAWRESLLQRLLALFYGPWPIWCPHLKWDHDCWHYIPEPATAPYTDRSRYARCSSSYTEGWTFCPSCGKARPEGWPSVAMSSADVVQPHPERRKWMKPILGHPDAR